MNGIQHRLESNNFTGFSRLSVMKRWKLRACWEMRNLAASFQVKVQHKHTLAHTNACT